MERRSGSSPRGKPRVNASACPHVTVERPIPDRVLVIITRRQTRVFSLSIPEAAELVAELLRQAPELVAELFGQAPELAGGSR